MDLTKIDYKKLLTNEKYCKDTLSHDLLEQFVTKLGHIPVCRNDDGKVNASKTYESISGTIYADILKVTYELGRGRFFTRGTSQKSKPTLGRFTPLAMYGLKRDQDINYEEWDKEDKWIAAFLGKDLKHILGVDQTQYDPMAIREHYLADAGFAVDAWPRKMLYQDLDKTPALIIGQIWLANASIRKSSMILDLDNWDNMPEALDEVVNKDSALEWGDFSKVGKVDEVKDLIW